MKRWLTFMLTLTIVVAFTGLSGAQREGVEKKPPTGVETRQRAQNWSPSHRYFCWDPEGTGFWSGSFLPGPVFFCVGPYARRPDHEPTSVLRKQVEDCKKAGGVWAGEDGQGGCTRP